MNIDDMINGAMNEMSDAERFFMKPLHVNQIVNGLKSMVEGRLTLVELITIMPDDAVPEVLSGAMISYLIHDESEFTDQVLENIVAARKAVKEAKS